MTAAPADVITLSVIWTRLIEICREMGAGLRKTAYSPAIREAEDCGVGLFDRRGRLLAQGVFTPGQVGSMPFALRAALDAIPSSTLRPGDGIILNDPYLGNGHLPDMFCFAPIFSEGKHIGFAGNCAHHLDVGGAAPGSQVTIGITDMYQEGIRILPLLAFRGGEPIEDIFRLITSNVRRPADMVGDLRAQMTTCTIGARRFSELVADYGQDFAERYFDELIARTEVATRAAIRGIPDGRYEFVDYLDDAGPDTGAVRIQVAVLVADDEITVDFTGTAPAVEAAINSPFNFTYAYTLFAIKALTDPSVPDNHGGREGIHVVAPAGCLLNPTPPSPTGGRATVAIRIVDAVMGALAQALPDRAVAAPSHFVNTTVGGIDDDGEAFVFYDVIMGGVGGRPHSDGQDGLVSCFNTANIPVEVHEATAPVLVERLEYLTDSAGPGHYRGGTGLRKVIRVLKGPVQLTTLSDRCTVPAWGLYGGRPGECGSAEVVRSDVRQALPSKAVTSLASGETIDYRVAGAGGWGDPFDREPASVLTDVLDGLVSPASAAADYGVALTADGNAVDDSATDSLRRVRQNA